MRSVSDEVSRSTCFAWMDLNHIIHSRGKKHDWHMLCRERRGISLTVLLVNRPLALRGHVTNTSFKQWVGILFMPKIDRAHYHYLTPEIWEETHLREIFYGTLIFLQSSVICIGRHIGGHTLALQQGTSSFQHFPWSLSEKLASERGSS